ncbi:30S ribosome-binding factor RbfA [Dissulfuribacter thermophilus]|nr:30S ribosome-binding factor RbfA [Dissulfuribacter thermophilus]
MVNPYPRSNRVKELIHFEVSEMLQREVKDPRLQGMVTIVEVEVTKDLRKAKIFVSVYGATDTRQKAMEGLNRAKGFIRHELWKRLDMKRVPEIEFVLDERVDHALKIERLLRERS